MSEDEQQQIAKNKAKALALKAKLQHQMAQGRLRAQEGLAGSAEVGANAGSAKGGANAGSGEGGADAGSAEKGAGAWGTATD